MGLEPTYNTYPLIAIPEKIQTWGVEDIFFKKNPEIFRFETLPSEIPDKTKFHNWKFHKIALHHLETTKAKNQDPSMEISGDFFLITP